MKVHEMESEQIGEGMNGTGNKTKRKKENAGEDNELMLIITGIDTERGREVDKSSRLGKTSFE